jgi:hypothetical protein
MVAGMCPSANHSSPIILRLWIAKHRCALDVDKKMASDVGSRSTITLIEAPGQEMEMVSHCNVVVLSRTSTDQGLDKRGREESFAFNLACIYHNVRQKNERKSARSHRGRNDSLCPVVAQTVRHAASAWIREDRHGKLES